MNYMLWANFLHIYQPPDQKRFIMDTVVQEAYRPIISILMENPSARITMSIIGCLLVELDTVEYRDVIDGFRPLVERGQIELTAGTMYHPFLPKLPDSEIVRQINLNNDIQHFYFKSAYNPKGFYSPEAGYSYRVAEIAHSLGYTWTIVDEIAYSGKLSRGGYDYHHVPGFYSGGLEIKKIVGQVSGDDRGPTSRQRKRSELSMPMVDYTKLYSIKGLHGFLVHFRERVISDALASGQIKTPEQFLKVLEPEIGKDRYLLTGTDGEAYGHHQKGLDHVLGQLYLRKALQTITISELPKHFPVAEEVEPIPSTWGTSEEEIRRKNYYARWHHIDNEIHDKQWALTDLAIHAVTGAGRRRQKVPEETRKMLDEALYSCHYWWASARPWWSIELIERGARSLADVVAYAEGYKGGIREVEKKKVIRGQAAKALHLYQDIVFTAFDWLRTEKVWDLSHLHK